MIKGENEMNKLYRFRTFGKEYSLDDVKNETITGITNDYMNDPYDCHFFIDITRAKKYIIKNDLIETLKLCTDYDLSNFDLESLIVYIANHLERCIELNFYTSCFTKNINKEIMWAHYAGDSRGYAIEYDYDEIIKKVKKAKSNDKFKASELSKVDYVCEKSDSTDLFIDYLKTLKFAYCKYGKKFLDVLNIPLYIHDYEKFVEAYKKIAFEKNKDWEYEEEYRLIVPNQDVDNYDLLSGHTISIKNIKSTAIYLGEKCFDENKNLEQIKELIKIARSKKINIYIMSRDYYNSNFCLNYKKLED